MKENGATPLPPNNSLSLSFLRFLPGFDTADLVFPFRTGYYQTTFEAALCIYVKSVETRNMKQEEKIKLKRKNWKGNLLIIGIGAWKTFPTLAGRSGLSLGSV